MSAPSGARPGQKVGTNRTKPVQTADSLGGCPSPERVISCNPERRGYWSSPRRIPTATAAARSETPSLSYRRVR